MTSGSAVRLASAMALAREPAPLVPVLVTTNVAAAAARATKTVDRIVRITTLRERRRRDICCIPRVCAPALKGPSIANRRGASAVVADWCRYRACAQQHLDEGPELLERSEGGLLSAGHVLDAALEHPGPGTGTCRELNDERVTLGKDGAGQRRTAAAGWFVDRHGTHYRRIRRGSPCKVLEMSLKLSGVSACRRPSPRRLRRAQPIDAVAAP
jgi:hypothetical protein